MALRMACSVLAIVAFAVNLAKPAAVETLICEDGFFSFGAEDVLEDVIVRRDGYLLLQGTTVLGSIKVEAGGVLTASDATIFGNVRAVRAYIIELGNCSVLGQVSLERTGRTEPPSDPLVGALLPSITIFRSDFSYNVRVSESIVSSIKIFENHIRGRLQLSRNASPILELRRNRIDKGAAPQ